MNDCLPQGPSGGQRSPRRVASVEAGPPDLGDAAAIGDPGAVDREIDVFASSLAAEPDLAHLSHSARRILAISAALFYRHGAAGTSIRDITKACGVSPGALYNHFASKDDLLHELVRHGHARLERRLDAAFAELDDDSPAARVETFVRTYVEGQLTQRELAQLVRREYVHLREPRRSEIVARRRALRAQLAAIMREGQRDGSFDLVGGESGATGTAVMVLDMCGRTSEWYDPARSDAPTELVDRYVAGALRLVANDDSGRAQPEVTLPPS